MIGLAGGLIGGGAIMPLGPVLADDGARRRQRRVRAADDRARHRRRDRRRHAARGPTARSCRDETVFTAAIVATGVSIIAVASMSTLTARARCSPPRSARRAGSRVRHRLHAAAGERLRRDARPHVRDALHDRAPVPAALADDRAVHREPRSARSPTRGSTATSTIGSLHGLAARRAARAVARRRGHGPRRARGAPAHAPRRTRAPRSPTA